MSVSDLHTVDQVAVIFGKTPRWVRDRVASGEIGHVRIGHSIRFTDQIINDYIESKTRASMLPAVNGWGRRRRRAS